MVETTSGIDAMKTISSLISIMILLLRMYLDELLSIGMATYLVSLTHTAESQQLHRQTEMTV